MNSGLRLDINTATGFQRALWGASWGTIGGLVCSGVALLQFLLRRETFTEQYHISFPALVAIYVVACAVAGIVVGLLLPITKWKWGSMVVGVMAILPIGAIIQHTTLRGRPWETANTVVLIIGAIAIGVPVGRIYSVLFQEQLRRGS